MASEVASLGVNLGIRGATGAANQNYSGGDLAYDIVISATDVGVDAAMDTGVAILTKSAAAGFGVSIAFVAVQILLDLLWNPFETKFNKDLEATRQRITQQWETELRNYNIIYPLTAKPDVMENMTDGEWKSFYTDVKAYFAQNNLVYPAELEQRDYAKRILDIQRRATYVSQTGQIIDIFTNSLQEQQKILDVEERSFAMLLAVAVLYKKRKEQLANKLTVQPSFIDKYGNLLQIGGTIFSLLMCICIIFSCIVVLRRKTTGS